METDLSRMLKTKLGRDHKALSNNFANQTVIADNYYYTEGSIAHGKLFRETEPYFPGDIPLENEYQYLPTGQLKWLIGLISSITGHNGISESYNS